jgi:signal transduction histidine kinase
VSGAPDQDLPPVTWVVLPNAINIVGLGLLTWGVATQIQRLDEGASQVAGSVLLVLAVLSWVLWVWLRNSSSAPEAAVAAPIVFMAVAGGALVAFAPLALVFTAVAALAAAMRWEFPVAAAVGGAGWVATLLGAIIAGRSIAVALGGLAAIFAGLMVGMSRRQAVEHAEQEARMEVETARAEVEHARAEVLFERNRLARELHDVLAHTLAALSLQLEAFSTVVDAEPGTSAAVREQLDRSRQLVREGLEEARGAVRALREDPAPLDEQLTKLCALHSAAFTVSGAPRPLPGQVVTNLYRVAQEALTNVMKHATGARTSVNLCYAPDLVGVTVENASGAAEKSLDASGGGYGLRGIEERLELLGGQMEAGPSPNGWRVAATVPAAATGGAPPGGTSR